MDELDSKLKNLEELEAARAKEAWEKHVVSRFFNTFFLFVSVIKILLESSRPDDFIRLKMLPRS